MPQHSLPPFPNSFTEPFDETSPPTPIYNCIAWAYGTNKIRLWPNNPYYQWPPNVPNEDNLDAFIQLFASVGYTICDNGDLFEGIEKIAIYAINGTPKHAAKQLETGIWSSKLGEAWDVSHSLFGIRGGMYGNEVVFMSRQRAIQIL